MVKDKEQIKLEYKNKLELNLQLAEEKKHNALLQAELTHARPAATRSCQRLAVASRPAAVRSRR